MTQTQQQIEHLRTLQESFDSLANVAEVQIPALSDKIDNIQLPKIDITELAKQGKNQDATNSKILEEIGNMADALTLIESTLETI